MVSRSVPSEPGILWIVATPIGNLEDMSPRGRRILAEVDRVAAEDTRVARKLFSALGIPMVEKSGLVSLHDHNEERAAETVLETLGMGKSVALISDAGTPLVSDPGFRLVRKAREAGLEVRTVPGPCAAIAALSVSGLAPDRFWFEGFLPARSAARTARLESLAAMPGTLIFFETGRRLKALLADMARSLGPGRQAVLARELTKSFETVLTGTVEQLAGMVEADADQQRGEMVVLVEGGAGNDPGIPVGKLARELISELPPARAAKLLARLTNLDRKEAWSIVEGLKK